MEKLAHYLDPRQAADRLEQLGQELRATEFALVRNLEYVFSPYELYPLAPRVPPPLERIVAFAVDMDGTSTTTEPLALHALEYMVRRITGRPDRSQWAGLDEHRDYPHVVGNSNFRHAEFLVRRYRDQINRAACAQAFIEALCWTLANMTDAQRRREVTYSARNCGLQDLLADPGFQKLVAGGSVAPGDLGWVAGPLVQRFGAAFQPPHDTALAAAALEIYYLHYHSILQAIAAGHGAQLPRELYGQEVRELIAPMPGYEVFVPLIKGWLGPESQYLYDSLRQQLLQRGFSTAEVDASRPRLSRLAEHFRRRPARLALVTASIGYEMQACVAVLLRAMQQQVQQWPLPAECRDHVCGRLADPRAVYDALVSASDASEMRLKPHRDLYSLALFQMGLAKEDYRHCVGLEDTEPGIIALRAAGIGCAVALPSRETRRQDYAAATAVLHGGLAELILLRNLLLREP